MSIQCSCPECGYEYRVADDLAGTSVLCPDCKKRFQVKGKSQRPARRDDEKEGRKKAGKGSGIPLWAWIGGGSALALLVLGGVVVVIVVVVVAAKNVQQAASRAAPQVEIDPAVGANLTFGNWEVFRGTDGLGRPGTWVTTTATAGGQKVESIDYQALLYDTGGAKLGDELLLMPNLAPGERGKVQIRLEDGTARVVIRKRVL